MEYKLLSKIFYSEKEKYEEVYQKRFNNESNYIFDFKIKKFNAFVSVNGEILKLTEEIFHLDKLLLSKIHELPDIAVNQFKKTCLIDEIKLTNEIEGVHSTRKEINEILDDKHEKFKKSRFYGLVKKYQMLSKENIEFKICEDIRKLYDEFVLAEVVIEDKENIPDGKIFRKNKVYVQNDLKKTIHNGLYPEENIIENMEKGLNILNNEEYGFLVRIAVFHYMFGYIHPFYDGNGRVSRFISSYFLSDKLEPLISYRLSYTIKEKLNFYYKMFKESNNELNKGDLTYFVICFLQIIKGSIEDLMDSLEDKSYQLGYLASMIKPICEDDENLETILFILIQNTLFGDFGIYINELTKHSKLSESKVRSCIKTLNDKKVLDIQKDGRKKIYDVDLENMIKYYDKEDIEE